MVSFIKRKRDNKLRIINKLIFEIIISNNNKFLSKIRLRMLRSQNHSLGGYPNEPHKPMHDNHCHGMVCVEEVPVHQHGGVGLDDDLQFLLVQDEGMVQVRVEALSYLLQLPHDVGHGHIGWDHGMACRGYCICNHDVHLHMHQYVHI